MSIENRIKDIQKLVKRIEHASSLLGSDEAATASNAAEAARAAETAESAESAAETAETAEAAAARAARAAGAAEAAEAAEKAAEKAAEAAEKAAEAAEKAAAAETAATREAAEECYLEATKLYLEATELYLKATAEKLESQITTKHRLQHVGKSIKENPGKTTGIAVGTLLALGVVAALALTATAFLAPNSAVGQFAKNSFEGIANTARQFGGVTAEFFADSAKRNAFIGVAVGIVVFAGICALLGVAHQKGKAIEEGKNDSSKQYNDANFAKKHGGFVVDGIKQVFSTSKGRGDDATGVETS